MELLQSLGVNQSVFFQFAIFAVTFFALIEIAFKPYAKAHSLREEKTTGSIENVAKLNEQREVMTRQYETETRGITDQIKTIFDTHREQAKAEADRLVGSARAEANQLVLQTRDKIQHQLGEATRKAQEEVPVLAQAIVKKLLA